MKRRRHSRRKCEYVLYVYNKTCGCRYMMENLPCCFYSLFLFYLHLLANACSLKEYIFSLSTDTKTSNELILETRSSCKPKSDRAYSFVLQSSTQEAFKATQSHWVTCYFNMMNMITLADLESSQNIASCCHTYSNLTELTLL